MRANPARDLCSVQNIINQPSRHDFDAAGNGGKNISRGLGDQSQHPRERRQVDVCQTKEGKQMNHVIALAFLAALLSGTLACAGLAWAVVAVLRGCW